MSPKKTTTTLCFKKLVMIPSAHYLNQFQSLPWSKWTSKRNYQDGCHKSSSTNLNFTGILICPKDGKRSTLRSIPEWMLGKIELWYITFPTEQVYYILRIWKQHFKKFAEKDNKKISLFFLSSIFVLHIISNLKIWGKKDS